ncbi:uncharacterized protein [Pyrus communis]|uniref:uncharacterized protein n=1 Tax=Pyrus communis TaxID=23211 RepID=UPI0035BFDEB5
MELKEIQQKGQQIDEMMKKLGSLQMDWGANAQEIEVLMNKVDRLWSQEESFWGWVDNPLVVRNIIDSHFTNLFTLVGQRDWGSILDCITPKVTVEMNETLTTSVLMEKVKHAALQMGGLKAPRPDGFQGIFYHSYWDIILNDVNELIVDLMTGIQTLNRLNATHVVLIPKVSSPKNVNQFHPISLCNYSYKVLSKVMVNRLKPLLLTLISTAQNAFVAGGQIQDNIGIGHEIFHFLKLRNTKRKFELGVTLDMHKAYDHVKWDFLVVVMERLGFNIYLIDEYCSASGQQVNLHKSNVFFDRNVPASLVNELTGILGMDKVDDPREYLGVPTIWGRSKKCGLAYVKGRLFGKLQCWKKSTLSTARKEVLIKAVAQVIPAYPMNLFKFPITFCKELDAMIANFWWGQKDGEHRIHWVSKEKLCFSKADGGLGFRNFVDFNDPLLAKQC